MENENIYKNTEYQDVVLDMTRLLKQGYKSQIPVGYEQMAKK